MVEDTLNYEMEAVGADTDSFFSAPPLEVPPAVPEAHRATITAVEGKEINDNWVKISVGLVSRDVPAVEKKLEILVPKAYADSIGSSTKFNPSSLPDNAQVSYRIGTANGDHTATLQTLVFNVAGSYLNGGNKQIIVKDSVARQSGRSLTELNIGRPTSFDDYVSAIDKMLSGLEVIMLLRERGGNDPAFAHRLEVREIVTADAFETTPRKFKGYNLAWAD